MTGNGLIYSVTALKLSAIIIEEGHANVDDHGAAHGDESALNQVKGRNIAHAGSDYDNRGDRGAGTGDGGREMHRQQEQHRRNAAGFGYRRGQGCKSKEGRVAGTHYDRRNGDNGYHDHHHHHGGEACALAAFDQGVDDAHAH